MIDQPPSSWRRALLNVVIAVHVMALFLWGLPDNRFASWALQPVQRYIRFAGLWHTWNMFSGDICRIQEDLRARITYKNAAVRQWIAPRMQELSIFQRMKKEHFRKWRELNFHDEFAGSWSATARFAAREMNADPTNPPVRVALIRFWSPTPAVIPNQDFQPLPKHCEFTHSYKYFERAIANRDLQ